MCAIPGVSENPAEFDWSTLPRLEGARAAVFRGVEGEAAFNLHAYLAWYDGKFWAMWSCGKVDEDAAMQHVRYSTSPDGLDWAPAQEIVPPERDSGMRYISRGFWVRDGKLIALASRDEAGRHFGDSLELRAYQWNAENETWVYRGVVYPNAINNFPPKQLPTGEWMMSRRDKDRNKSMLIGGVDGIDKWDVTDVAVPEDGARLEEPFWWILPDGRLLGVFRDNSRSKWLYRAFGSPDGRDWTTPTRTNFPDATAKFNALRLEDGRYVLVSNPNPTGRNPLCLSLSEDGITFTEMYILRDAPTEARYEGLHKIFGYHYPHILGHGGHLYIIHAENKEDIVVLRVAKERLE